MIDRQIAHEIKSARKSILLVGPRQTGKSTLIQSLHPNLELNLAHEPTFLELARDPAELERRIKGHKTIFIDEVQRLPKLLNTVQYLLDHDKSLRFFLTGSSARKLRRGGGNLLPGRILEFHLGPLTYQEIGSDFDLELALSTGLLPGIYTEPDRKTRKQVAAQYAASYLREEIAAEGFVRNLEGFARFLSFAAIHAAQVVDISKLSAKALVHRPTAGRFFEILEQTLVIRRCPAFAKSGRRRLIQHPKFYFFDTGVWNGLLKNFVVSEDRRGPLFETFVFNQIFDGLSNRSEDFSLSFFRTEHGSEVDLILQGPSKLFAIEVKAGRNVGKSDLRGFRSFGETYGSDFTPIVLYTGQVEREMEGVAILPWQRGLDRILKEA